jgi:hypothetical protein
VKLVRNAFAPVLLTMSSTNPKWTASYCNGLGIFKISSN